MTKRQKREAAIRRTPQQVRFADLDALLDAEGFVARAEASHYTYTHRRYGDLRGTMVKPHGGAAHVKPVYVLRMLALIDMARERRNV